MKIARECPFCNERLAFDTTKGVGLGVAICSVSCENDDCEVKPFTDYGTPSRVLEEAKYFGKINKSVLREIDDKYVMKSKPLKCAGKDIVKKLDEEYSQLIE